MPLQTNMIKIITPVCNNPTFIRMQYEGFKKHIHEPYEFIVYNDCKRWPDYSNFNDITLFDKIHAVCNELGLTCIDVPNESHRQQQGASWRHAGTMNWIFERMRSEPGEYFIIDSDMFLIDTLDLNKYRQKSAAVVPQERPGIHYIWPNLFYMDTRRLSHQELMNFNPTRNADSGGSTYDWLSKQTADDVYMIRHFPSMQWDTLPRAYVEYPALLDFLKGDPRNRNGKYFCEIYEETILHYRAGSDWEKRGRGIHTVLTERLTNVLLPKAS
jgi:hypothetical protein